MLFKVMTVGKTGAIIKQEGGYVGSLVSKNIMIPPGIVLEVYGYANADETRFVVWNEHLSTTFFTVSVADCRPAY